MTSTHVLVPVEPTEAMCEAGWQKMPDSIGDAYRAMVAAAPAPPEDVRGTIAQIVARAYGGSLYPGLGMPGDYPVEDVDYRAADAILALMSGAK